MRRVLALCLLIVFGSVVFFRLAATTAVPFFSDDDSYQELRRLESFSKTGDALFHDPLSFKGRDTVFNPLLPSVLSLMYSTTDPIYWYKVVLNIIAATLVIFIFLAAWQEAQNLVVSLATAAIAGFTPLYSLITINAVTPLSILLPLSFLSIFLYLGYRRHRTKAWFYTAFGVWALCSVLHPLFLVFTIGHICYVGLMVLEKQKLEREELEFSLIMFLIGGFVNYLIYSKAFLTHGVGLLQHLLIFSPYVDFNQILHLLPQTGLFLLACGIYIVYSNFFHILRTETMFLTGMMISTTLLTVFSLISADIGLLFISLLSALLIPHIMVQIEGYLLQTKLKSYTHWIIVCILSFLFITVAIPTFFYVHNALAISTDPTLVQSLTWVADQTVASSLLIVPVDIAQTSMFFSKRMTLADTDTMLIADAPVHAARIKEIYSAFYRSQIIEMVPVISAFRDQPLYVIDSSQIRSMQKRDRSLLPSCFIPVFNTTDATVFNMWCSP